MFHGGLYYTEITLNALKLTNLSLNKDDHSILKDVSLNLSYGELYIILGKNGAGKSSLFRCIAGIESDYLGDIDKLMSDESSQGNNKCIYIPDKFTIPPYLSVNKYMSCMQALLSKFDSYDRAKYKFLISQFNDIHIGKKKFGELSKGMRKIAFISLMLAINHKLVILDEPFEGLDINNKEILLKLLEEEAKSGKLILLSTHELQMINNRSNTVIGIRNGSVTGILRKRDLNLADVQELI